MNNYALSELTLNNQNNFTDCSVTVVIKDILQATSKTDKIYQLCLVEDDTGSRILYNCDNIALEKSKIYTLTIRPKFDEYKFTGFIKNAVPLNSNPVFFECKKLNYEMPMIQLIQKQLILKVHDVEIKNYKVVILKDDHDYKYYFRIWPDDQLYDAEWNKSSYVTLKNIAINKKQENKAPRFLSKVAYTKVLFEN
jgi:hypothetical protein